MGIKGLLPELKNAITCIHNGDQLQQMCGGKVAGIDVLSWIHQRLHTMGDQLFLKQPGAMQKIIDFILDMINVLRDSFIFPLVVFDGMSLPAKQGTNHERQK